MAPAGLSLALNDNGASLSLIISLQPQDSVPVLWPGPLRMGQDQVPLSRPEAEEVHQVRGGGAGSQHPRGGASLRHYGGPD